MSPYYSVNLKNNPGVLRTNDALESYNQRITANFTENLLLPVNDFLATFREWTSKESRRFSNACACSSMKHIPGKTSRRAITRIRHVWREGQKEYFDFLMKDEAWYVFKSEYGRTIFPNLETNVLCMDFLTVENVHSFDHLIKKYKSMREIWLNNDEWYCTCPY